MLRFPFVRPALLSLCVGLLLSFTVNAQISGTIRDQHNREPLEGVAIMVSGRAETAVTDASGAFFLHLPEGTHELVCRRLGYQTLVVRLEAPALNRPLRMEIANMQLSEVMVTALETGRRLREVPAVVGVIARADLHRDSEINIMPALNRVPGVWAQTGTFSTQRITIRGIGSRTPFGSNKIRAYFQDIPLTGGDGETNLEDLDLQLLGRAEVLKGPASSLYGAGLGGVILLDAPRPTQEGLQVWQEAMAGSFGLLRSVTGAEASGDFGSVRALYSYTHSDGFRENNRYDRYVTGAVADLNAGERTSVALTAIRTNMKAFIPSSVNKTSFRNTPRAAAPNWQQAEGYEDYERTLLGASLQHQAGQHLHLTTSVFTSQKYSYEPRPFNILREQNSAYGMRTRLTYVQPTWRATVGGEWFKEQYQWQTYQIRNRQRGNIISDNQEIRRFGNWFAQAEATLGEKWKLSGGANLNFTTYDYTDFFLADGTDRSGQYRFEALLSPRVGVVYMAGVQQSWFASVSHGFSPPSVSETLTPQGTLNPDIRPETGWSFEAGWKTRHPELRAELEVNAYYMPVRDLLVARRTADDAFLGINAGKTLHQGVEVAAAWMPLPYTEEQMPLRFGLAYAFGHFRFQDFQDGDQRYDGNFLPGAPPHQLNLTAESRWRFGLYAFGQVQHVAPMFLQDSNTSKVEGWTVANIRAGWKKQWKHLFADLYGGLQNIADALYSPMVQINAAGTPQAPPRYYYPGMPRNFYTGVQVGMRW